MQEWHDIIPIESTFLMDFFLFCHYCEFWYFCQFSFFALHDIMCNIFLFSKFSLYFYHFRSIFYYSLIYNLCVVHQSRWHEEEQNLKTNKKLTFPWCCCHAFASFSLILTTRIARKSIRKASKSMQALLSRGKLFNLKVLTEKILS